MEGKQYVANNFVQTNDGILTLDVDYSQAAKYDTLDVAGALFADGTLNVNFASAETITDSTLKFLNAYKIYGNFDTIRLQNIDNLNAQGKFVNTTSFKNNLADGLTFQSGTVLNSSTAQNVAWNAENTWSGATANADLYVGLYAVANGGADQSVTLTTTDTVKTLTLGYNAGANGALTIADGGNLTVSGSMSIGAEGNGTLTQTGGEVKVNDLLYVGRHAGSTGTLTISGGKFTAGSADSKNLLAYGNNSTATFNISGNADVTISGMNIAPGSSSRGTVNISGGKVTSTQPIRVGSGGNSVGTLNQTGGEFTTSNAVYLSDSSTSATGIMNLSGGKFTLTNSIFCVGTYNTAALTISGNHEFSIEGNNSQFIIGYGLGKSQNPTVKQLGGNVTIQNGIQFGNDQAQAVNGLYQMTSGTLTTSNITEKDTNNNVTALFKVSGTAKADVSGDISVPVVMNNGTLNAGSISSTATVSGGQLDVGTINGEVTMTGGTLSPGGNGKVDMITIANGGKLSLDSAGVIESGNIALNRPAAQSSNYNTANQYPASKAVNGNKGDFTHTSRNSGKNQWWEVEFAESTKISTVNLYNRIEFDRRIVGDGNGYHFELYDGTIANPGTLLWSSPIYTEYTSGAAINLDTPVDGKLLRLVRDFSPNTTVSRDDLTLNLAEVEVYSNQNLVAMLEMDLFADGTSDLLVLNEGATLELDDAGIKLNFDTTQMPESNLTWDLFSIADGATITGEFSAENMILPELTGFWEWDFSDLYSMGKISLTNTDPNLVPEPATWVLLVLGFATLGLVRTRSRS
ncbi:MAG: discoidin domain-containing protein [Planctomycetia bacterium]|nr:discoidin domain-containing protein [Planctomycetia bacterium]